MHSGLNAYLMYYGANNIVDSFKVIIIIIIIIN